MTFDVQVHGLDAAQQATLLASWSRSLSRGDTSAAQDGAVAATVTAALSPATLPEAVSATAPAPANHPNTANVASNSFVAETFGELSEILTQRVTLAAITAARGSMLMLHAGAVADPDTGASIVFVGPSGRGKTTASRALGARFGYITDETVGILDNHRIVPYTKPLSIIDGGSHKSQVSPDALGLAPTPANLHVHRMLLLDRTPDGPEVPEVHQLDLADALEELVPQTSYLSALPNGLQQFANVVASTGGIRVVRYREASTLGDIVAGMLAEPALPASAPTAVPTGASTAARAPAVEEWRSVVDPRNQFPTTAGAPAGLPTASIHRTDFVDAIDNGEVVVVLRDLQVRVIGGIGATVWLASAEPLPLDRLVRVVLDTHGQPPTGDAHRIVEATVAELVDAGLLAHTA